MSTFSLKIISSNRTLYEGKASAIIVPGTNGLVEILAHHENMVIAVDDGEARYQTEDGIWHDFVVGIGMIRVMNNRVLLLSHSAEWPEEIDIQRAQEAKARAEEALRQKQSIQDFYRSKASLQRAMNRLKGATDTHRH